MFCFALFIVCSGILGVVNGAVVYTRWGRQTCGSLGELVYTGYIGSSNGYGDTGGGSNHLCVPRSPQFENYDSTFYERGRLYGAEYETYGRSDNFPFDLPDEPWIANRNALCAVCRVENASTILMIPAKTDCYPGWTMEYGGYLVSTPYDYQKSEFICLDKSPETAPSDGGSEPTMHLTTVEGVCGSLPCPPYESGWEITCVVCTM